jgi:hypothetical protein
MTSTTRPPTGGTVLRLLLETHPYLSCDDYFAQLDQYVERRVLEPGYDESRMRTHLEGMRGLAEEAETLRSLVLEPPRWAHRETTSAGPSGLAGAPPAHHGQQLLVC